MRVLRWLGLNRIPKKTLLKQEKEEERKRGKKNIWLARKTRALSTFLATGFPLLDTLYDPFFNLQSALLEDLDADDVDLQLPSGDTWLPFRLSYFLFLFFVLTSKKKTTTHSSISHAYMKIIFWHIMYLSLCAHLCFWNWGFSYVNHRFTSFTSYIHTKYRKEYIQESFRVKKKKNKKQKIRTSKNTTVLLFTIISSKDLRSRSQDWDLEKGFCSYHLHRIACLVVCKIAELGKWSGLHS